MRKLTLYEYRPSAPVVLTVDERDALSRLVPTLTIAPERGSKDAYVLTPGAEVGGVFLPDLAIEIRPKVPVDRLLFLVSYALDPKHWKQLGFAFDQSDSLVEAMVPGFVAQLKRSLHRGLLQGYRGEQDSLMTVRGRVRFEEQLRKRPGVPLPVEVVFDEFTEDILENQLLLAALHRLKQLRLRSQHVIQSLRHTEFMLQNVSLKHFGPRELPHVVYSRLNRHYEPAIELAKLILSSSSIEVGHGGIDSAAFLVNMNAMFEQFVVVALREALGLTSSQFRKSAARFWLALDDANRIRLRPDLFWLENEVCVFLGDVKYKYVDSSGVKHHDLYQLLAYTIAANVPSGLLVYAAGEGERAVHTIPMCGKTLEVVTLDIAGTPNDILLEIDRIAQRVRCHRARSCMSDAV